MILKQSTARNRVIIMVDSADGKTGKTGLTLTIKMSKNGGAYATVTPTVTELETGSYSLALTTAHTDTLGDLALKITGAGADMTDVIDQVCLGLPDVVPTAVENADALLKRDMSAVTGESSRSPLNALRLLRNKWTVIAGTLSVKKEDDSTQAWASTLTSDAAADPIVQSDPS